MEDFPSLKGHHLDIIEKYGGEHAGKLLAGIAAAQIIVPLVKTGIERFRTHENYTITVSGTDDIYPDLHEWVLARIPEEERKAMIASTTEGRGRAHVSYDGDNNEAPPLRLRYDGSRTQVVTINGCKVEVAVSREESMGGREKIPEEWRRYLEKITFSATSTQGRDAIIKMIEGLQKAKYEEDPGPPPLMIPSRWGGSWVTRNDLPERTLDSVILKEGQIEYLVDDLETFFNAEEAYDRVNQPWHRGYLFHGAPGTGKTSIARALANHFGTAMYYLPLADLEKDADLMSLVSSIEPKSMLLLEDVDVFHAMTERNDEEGTTIAAMLNALDGVWTPHGLITIMTTNNRDALDDALLRAGRVDIDEEFTPLDGEQAVRLAAYILEDEVDITFAHKFIGHSPADLIQALRKQQQETKCKL